MAAELARRTQESRRTQAPRGTPKPQAFFKGGKNSRKPIRQIDDPVAGELRRRLEKGRRVPANRGSMPQSVQTKRAENKQILQKERRKRKLEAITI